MSSNSRDKVALIVFLLLFFAVGALLVGYLLIGHAPLNVAASNIDDASGSMEGYTAITFDGTSVPTSNTDEDTDPVTLTSVEDSYASKNASVLSLDVVHPQQYAEGFIYKIGPKRIAVLSCQTPQEYVQLQVKLDYFKNHQVDYTVCIADDPSLVTNSTGLDIVIYKRMAATTKDYKQPTGMVDGIYYVQTPAVGHIGTVIISPHNMVSSKDISSL